MRRRLPPGAGLPGSLREHIVSNEEVVYKPLEELFVDAPWYQGRVVLVGDAVHATTPHLGQGRVWRLRMPSCCAKRCSRPTA